jgi:hypothetical protein
LPENSNNLSSVRLSLIEWYNFTVAFTLRNHRAAASCGIKCTCAIQIAPARHRKQAKRQGDALLDYAT